MPMTRPALSAPEEKALFAHLQKHKIYPFRYRFRQLIDATQFATADGAIGSYRTYTFTPDVHLGIVSIAANFIITPNTTVGTYALAVSYANTFSLQDGGNLTKPDDEATVIYELKSNGGAINDFQVYYPLNIYVEANKPIYFHLWADAATVTAGTSTMSGHVVFGSLLTGQK